MGQDPSTGGLFTRRGIDNTGMTGKFMRLNIW